MPRNSTRATETMQTFLAVINDYKNKGRFSETALWRLLDLCEGTKGFDFRSDKRKEKERKKLIRASCDLLVSIMEAVEKNTQFVQIKNPFEQSLEISPPS